VCAVDSAAAAATAATVAVASTVIAITVAWCAITVFLAALSESFTLTLPLHVINQCHCTLIEPSLQRQHEICIWRNYQCMLVTRSVRQEQSCAALIQRSGCKTSTHGAKNTYRQLQGKVMCVHRTETWCEAAVITHRIATTSISAKTQCVHEHYK
jgi:hypothetical protein